MAISQILHWSKPYLQKFFLLLWGLLLAMIASACVLPSAGTQPFSPLNPGTTAALAGKRWTIVEVTLRNELIPIEAIKPIEVWFDPVGALNFSSAQCTGGAYLILFSDENHYTLSRGDISAVGCTALREQQMARMLEALKATTAYAIRGNQLRLTGSAIQIVLEIAQSH